MQRTKLLLSACLLSTSLIEPSLAQWSTESLSNPRGEAASVQLGNLAFFAGGRVGNNLRSRVDIYDASTGAWSMASLSSARTAIGAATAGNHVLFAGGATGLGVGTDVVDVYDHTTGTWSTATLSEPRFSIGATTIGMKAYFAGGANGPMLSDVVDVYDATIGPPSMASAWSTMQLSTARAQVAAVSVGDVAIFAGGQDNVSAVADVDIYDATASAWTVASLTQARVVGSSGAVASGTRAYFGGGQATPGPSATMSDVVDVYDGTSGVWSTLTLSEPRGHLGAAAVGNEVLFAGGARDGFVPTATIDRFNAGTGTVNSTEQLTVARHHFASVSIGGRAMFAGGFAASGPSDVVDVFEPIGIHYCVSNANSTGSAAAFSVSGNRSVAANDLTLRADSLPAMTFGYFLTSRTQGFAPNPGGSDGTLCLAGAIGRYVGPGQVQMTGAAGVMVLALDLGTMPTPTALVAAQAGETWNFQGWYRDSGSSNLTDAIAVTLE